MLTFPSLTLMAVYIFHHNNTLAGNYAYQHDNLPNNHVLQNYIDLIHKNQMEIKNHARQGKDRQHTFHLKQLECIYT